MGRGASSISLSQFLSLRQQIEVEGEEEWKREERVLVLDKNKLDRLS